MYHIGHKFVLLLLMALLLQNCVEPYEVETKIYENMLVVEATITDEYIHHEILLSETISLNEQIPVPVTNANVTIVDNAQNIFVFEEKDPGKYISVSKFAAQPNRRYHLEIVTTNGKIYSSEPQELIEGSQIDELKAIRTESGHGTDGIAVILDSQGNSPYYRYDYKETYKIVSNFAISKDLVYVKNEDGVPIPTLVAKTKEEYICYNTRRSNEIVISSTNSLTTNILDDFLVRFIETGDPKISHRYSILVKQYAIGAGAYSFFQTIKDLSISESLFSQSQPGFVNGNIVSLNDSEEKVIGYFSVSSVDSKRIFFDYTDFYGPLHERPSFATSCSPMRPSIKELGAYISNDNFRFFEESSPPPGNYGFPPSNYVFVNAGCVDCTVFGSNVAPEFWIKE